MRLILRTPTEADWQPILAIADRASPWKKAHNPAWLAARQTRLKQGLLRFHVLAEGENGELLGYAALEAGEKPGWLRVFLVVTPENLETVGKRLYGCLEARIRLECPEGLWLREEPGDSELLAFFTQKGFQETFRGPVADSLQIVIAEKRLDEGVDV